MEVKENDRWADQVEPSTTREKILEWEGVTDDGNPSQAVLGKYGKAN